MHPNPRDHIGIPMIVLQKKKLVEPLLALAFCFNMVQSALSAILHAISRMTNFERT